MPGNTVAHKGASGTCHLGSSLHKLSSGRGRNRRAPTVPGRAGIGTELVFPLGLKITLNTAGPSRARTQEG